MPTVWWLSCPAFCLPDTCKVSFPWAGLVVEPVPATLLCAFRTWHYALDSTAHEPVHEVSKTHGRCIVILICTWTSTVFQVALGYVGGRRFGHFLPLQTPENWGFSWLLLKNLSFTVLHCTCRQVSPDLGMGWGQVRVSYRSNRTTDKELETFAGWNILNFICILQRCPLKPFTVHAWWLLIQAGVNSLFILFFHASQQAYVCDNLFTKGLANDVTR